MKITEDVRKYTAEQGMEPKSKDSSRWAASEKVFAQRKAEGQGCWSSRSQFAEKGAEV
jgi:hypothetical protein